MLGGAQPQPHNVAQQQPAGHQLQPVVEKHAPDLPLGGSQGL